MYTIFVVSLHSTLHFLIVQSLLSPEQQLQKNDGEKQYHLLKTNANLPQYGHCWTDAIAHLDNTCAHLTDAAQATLALKFTKCFMEMSGGVGDDAAVSLCDIDDSLCMNQLPERVFQAYTHFYTHTQNICFYLMHQVWHDETEQTINLLRTHSQSVSKQLEIAGRLQLNLLQQQREGLKVQRQLVEHGMNLSDVLHESRGNLARLTADFRNSTVEHGRQLTDLFKRLAMLHNWFIGEYSFIEQIIYYVAAFILIMIMTTSKRTENSRFVLYLLAGLNLMLEITFQQFLQTDSFDNDSHVKFLANIWIIRKLFIGAIVVVYVAMATFYVDQQRLTLSFLTKIHDQNLEMLKLLRQLIENGSQIDCKALACETVSMKYKANALKVEDVQMNHLDWNILRVDKGVTSRATPTPVHTINEKSRNNNDDDDDSNNSKPNITSDLSHNIRLLRPRRKTPQIA